MMNTDYIKKTMQKEKVMKKLEVELDSLSTDEIISILDSIKNIYEIDKIQKMYFIRIEDKPYTIIIDSYNTVYSRYKNTYVPLEYIPDGDKLFKVLVEIM